MKTILLLFTGMLLSIHTVTAENPNKDHNVDATKHYRFAQPITFMERGVEFLIFPDGSFDFNTNYMVNSRRNTVNVTYNGPKTTINYTSSRPIKTNITRDRNGMIRSINNIFINYDRFGKVTRIGNVFMDYEHGKKGILTHVGNLRVKFNRWGEIVATRGYVNRENRFVAYNTVRHNDYVNNNERYDNDNNYYYFKQDGNVKKQKKR
ncbi:hypothetical protein [Confluentibacter sediminis]|uniref:hypothetical protein n=1 Tax=Confluentibacter sediminis TaxID=2219045 RepID=UPI000DAD1E5A|nr:hypothetical protein [Confluentibacter sediminis]